MNDWRDDLKTCLMKCGLEEKVQTFLLEDSQVTHEAMMEDINNVLNYGDLPNLYKKEDMEEILNSCKSVGRGGETLLCKLLREHSWKPRFLCVVRLSVCTSTSLCCLTSDKKSYKAPTPLCMSL